MITRRTALQWLASAAGGAMAGPGVFPGGPAAVGGAAPPLGSHAAVASLPDRWLIDTTGRFWPVDDVFSWLDAHVAEPLLARARLGLARSDDPDRRLRLVLRRCGLQYVEIAQPPNGGDPADGLGPARATVTVQHWSVKHGELRPFFKALGLAREGVTVELVNRKSEQPRRADGRDFLFGQPLDDGPDPALLASKWHRRDEPAAPDWSAATTRNWLIAWPGFKPPGIPWVALESAWRRVLSPDCPNCDRPTILSGFGIRPTGWFSGRRLCEFTCLQCGQRQEEAITDFTAWCETHLDPHVRPVKRWA